MNSPWSVYVIVDEDDDQFLGGAAGKFEQQVNVARLKAVVRRFVETGANVSIVHQLGRLETSQCESQLWSKTPDCVDRLGHLSIVARQIAIQRWMDAASEGHENGDSATDILVICSRQVNSEKRTIGIASVKRESSGGLRSGYMTAVLTMDPGQIDESGQISQLAETITDFFKQMNGAKNLAYETSLNSRSVRSEQFIYSECDAGITQLMASNKLDVVRANCGSCILIGDETHVVEKAVLPGSFHPLHHGHLEMAAAAEEILGCDVAFELSIVNADKPPLDILELNQRAHQDFAGRNLLLTNAGRFVDKARVFKNRTFVVGVDTICRIGDTRFYEDSDAKMESAVQAIASSGCRFLVFGRKNGDKFIDVHAAEIPDLLAEICICVDEKQFRADVSSTELRRRLSHGFWEPEL